MIVGVAAFSSYNKIEDWRLIIDNNSIKRTYNRNKRVIKNLTKNDNIDQLVRLFDEYRIFYGMKSDLKQAETFLKKRLELNESIIFVAINDDKDCIGFTQLYPLFSSTKMQKLWLLNDLYVEKAHRGKGYFIALMDAAKAYCKKTDCCGILLETAKDNHRANKLYIESMFTLDESHNYYFWENNSD